MNTTNKVLIGIIAGAATGAIFGLLFAPHKGSKTRKRMLNRGREIVQELEDKVNETKDALTEIKKGITQAVMEKVDQFAPAERMEDKQGM